MDEIPFIKSTSAQKKLLKSLLDPISQEVAEQQLYLKKTNESYLSYVEHINRIEGVNSTSKFIGETLRLKKELYIQLDSEFPPKQDTDVFKYFQKFFKSYETVTSEIPVEKIEIQTAERFLIQENDTLELRVKKIAKQFFFAISKLIFGVFNLVRTEKRPLNYWNHKIPLKAMFQLHFQQDLVQKSLPFFNEIQRLKCEAREIKWAIHKEINSELTTLLDKKEISFDEFKGHLQEMAQRKRIQEIIASFQSKLETWKLDINKTLESNLAQFQLNYELVDTIELDSSIYSASALNEYSTSIQFEFKKILNGWRNTQFAQIDDFQIDLELYQLKYSGLTQYYLLENGCKTRIAKTNTNFINPIASEIEAVIEKVDNCKNTDEIRDLLVSERIKLHHQLEKKSIPNAINALYENNFPNLIERMETKIQAQLELMKDTRIISSKEIYDAPIPKSNLSHFNPKELVEVDLMTPFSNSLFLLKTMLIEKLSTTELGLNDLVGIVDYNLDAATNSVDGELNLEEVKNIAKDGLERACARTRIIAEDLQGVSTIISIDLKKELDALINELIKLTKNENISNLWLKLAKAKAIEKTKAYRKELLDKVRNFVPIAIRFGQQKIFRLKGFSVALQEKIGLIETNNEITTELSDFLLQSEKAIQQLPYVYRRLYELKPLEEEGFFEGRIQESAKLEEAFNHWQNSNISSAVIVGEKGSGASSLLNQFVRGHHESSIIRRKMSNTAYTAEAFSNFFNGLFEHETLLDFNGIVEFLNNGPKRIIILEDIQQFYLKKTNGFEAITLLFELISQTSKNIFWLVAISSFSWNYFQKTIAIERYIRHKIVLSRLSDDQIVKLIMKRHRVSGYNLRFDVDQKQRKDLFSILRKPVDNSQAGLQKSFFAELNTFAQSNISLALLYWLRSTISFEDNTVIIGKIKNIKFDFLTTLDSTSIFTLHSLLLHDTLSINEHAEVFHQAERQSRMTLMVLEDSGILISKNGEFSINQLIYRQVVNVLRKKNLIH